MASKQQFAQHHSAPSRMGRAAQAILLAVLTLFMSAGLAHCDSDQSELTTVPEMGNGQTLLYNGRFITMNDDQPFAEAVLIDGPELRYVGDLNGARKAGNEDAREYDLQGRTIMPGIVDAHTHPGLVAVLGGGAEEDPIPTTTHDDIMNWLAEFANENPFALLITAGAWPTKLYGPDGPRKEDLDEIVAWRPVLLFDDSGHSLWANSMMLWLLGVDANTPDPAPGLSFFARDENGEPTGWIKEFAAVPQLSKFFVPDHATLKANLRAVLSDYSAFGITTLFDAGNLLSDDEVYAALADLEREGRLPVRYEASYHILYPGQLPGAIAELERLREQYGGARLRFNTIKIHFDGVSEIRTAAMLDEYADRPGHRGRTLFDESQLSRFMIELHRKRIDLHIHAVGDQAVRTALNARDNAERRVGSLNSRVTLSHLESVHPADMSRFRARDLYANFTPHWFGGYFGDAIATLGKNRSDNRQLVKSIFDAGATITFSSDVTTSTEAHRANPFFGMRLAALRREPGADSPITPPALERLPVEQVLRAYTRNGAAQLGLEQRIGSIETGKAADLLVLDRDPLTAPLDELHEIQPIAVLLDGEIVSGEWPSGGTAVVAK